MKWGSWGRHEWLHPIFLKRHWVLSWAYSSIGFTVSKKEVVNIWWAVPCVSRSGIAHWRKFRFDQKLFFLVWLYTVDLVGLIISLRWLLFIFIDAATCVSYIFFLCFRFFINSLVSILKDYFFTLKMIFWLIDTTKVVIFWKGWAWYL